VLLPLAGRDGVLGVALSGAGPGVLLILDSGASIKQVTRRIHEVSSDPDLEVLETRVAGGVQIESMTLSVT